MGFLSSFLSLKDQCSGFNKGKKVLGSYLQTMSTYPDMPYDCIPILHPDTANVLYTPTELSKGLRNKENALIDLVKRKKEEGEKVLIYYEWTNKTDVASKLIKALEDEGIKAVDLTSKVKAKDREVYFPIGIEEDYIALSQLNEYMINEVLYQAFTNSSK